jgi:hypothetical protein
MAMRLRIFVPAPHAVLFLCCGLRSVLIPWRSKASGTAAGAAPAAPASAATRGEIRPIQRTDEETLKSARALHPEALQVGMSVRKAGESRARRARLCRSRLSDKPT